MNRKGHISEKIATPENYEEAASRFEYGKTNRDKVIAFNKNRQENLTEMRLLFIQGKWKTSEYTSHIIYEPKRRVISKLPIKDHIQQWAELMQIEDLLTDTYVRQSCSCVRGRGTHDFLRLLRKQLYADPTGTRYFVQLDVHHFFPNIMHWLMKERIRTKIKDEHLLAALDEFIDSHLQGLPLGVKISQILANFFLAKFDHDAMDIFNIAKDTEKMHYWRRRYVNDCIETCRTQEQANELNKGIAYLNSKFDRYLKQTMRHHYLRFADNIIMHHEDKVFLRIMVELCTMTLARDYLLQINKSWNIRPVDSGGIDVCGYVFYHDHITLRKRNKKGLCKAVATQRKKGKTPEEIRRACASRIGFATHANCNNLLKKLDINMAGRLGKSISRRRHEIPFEGMSAEQKIEFSEIVCPDGSRDETPYLIYLEDFRVDDSKIEFEDVVIEQKDSRGQTTQKKVTQPKKRLAIRFKRIKSIKVIGYDEHGDEEYQYEFVKRRIRQQDGTYIDTDKDAEFYAYTGSGILVSQALEDICREELPKHTVIQQCTNKQGKRYTKFT